VRNGYDVLGDDATVDLRQLAAQEGAARQAARFLGDCDVRDRPMEAKCPPSPKRQRGCPAKRELRQSSL
jgi:hypothetical protein